MFKVLVNKLNTIIKKYLICLRICCSSKIRATEGRRSNHSWRRKNAGSCSSLGRISDSIYEMAILWRSSEDVCLDWWHCFLKEGIDILFLIIESIDLSASRIDKVTLSSQFISVIILRVRIDILIDCAAGKYAIANVNRYTFLVSLLRWNLRVPIKALLG